MDKPIDDYIPTIDDYGHSTSITVAGKITSMSLSQTKTQWYGSLLDEKLRVFPIIKYDYQFDLLIETFSAFGDFESSICFWVDNKVSAFKTKEAIQKSITSGFLTIFEDGVYSLEGGGFHIIEPEMKLTALPFNQFNNIVDAPCPHNN
jgi:hypothetical protein